MVKPMSKTNSKGDIGMFIQEYLVHLSNGDVVIVSEPYDLRGPQSLISQYETAKPDSMFCVGDGMTGFSYFPMRNITYISTGAVRKITEETYRLTERMRSYGG